MSRAGQLAQARMLSDYTSGDLIRRVQPAQGPFGPMTGGGNEGPTQSPVSTGKMDEQQSVQSLLMQLLRQVTYQNVARTPIIRSVTETGLGSTLDWSSIGMMDRLMIRNAGPQSVYFAFDVDGPSVDMSNGDLSFWLQANESVNISHCKFYKIGVRTIAGGGVLAVVNAIAFQSVAGDQAGSLS